ncbi:fungal-specific transcription factor domain-containing protein [Boeremia exigua]|uniref:fungal-specific transcription factor domain-containing protein n=1 Tax=Boeremia exigua TaxID=749465 RepID=UPI001E8D5FE2|nr:fungal-specific transcription factor domain-containing protein [Boeremia exigua]KAH6644473.1 fungal-specific transcription factor domain-containing protein [Boeremia exigua]
MGHSSGSDAVSNSSQKRPAQDAPESTRPKRAKYTSTACNECKRCKVKCIQIDDNTDCQRCSTMSIACIVIPTATQTAKEKEKGKEKSSIDDSSLKQLTEDVTFLREQLTTLMGTVAVLAERRDSQLTAVAERTPASQQTASPAYTNSTSQRTGLPRQPQFTGPTRAAFSLNIVESSLNRMGIPPDVHNPDDHTSSVSSREATPEIKTALAQNLLKSGVQGLSGISNDDIERLLLIYQEEVASVHPIIETKDLMADAPHIMELVRNPQRPAGLRNLGKKDIHILRLAVATAITHEILGKNDLSDRLIFEIEQDVGRISSETEVELKDIQIMGMLSLYFCHTEEELFAWRAIGRASRQALEMGLHRRQSLLDNFKDPEERKLAVQVFWVIYELDRRWSFGTSLSFALNDRDIDTQLPEPGKSYPYLKGMIAYARLCSRVWEALPPYGSALQTIPKETEDYLDFITSNWLLSIPEELQFRHPRLGLAKSQPRLLHRLRTLLYLRGNHMRTLIHRHHVLTPDNIKADMESARLVVDVARDSIQVLVHLNETSDIYARQQSVYHYYLLSSLAVLLLAVCHAPSMFAEASRESFVSAVELVKGFSRHGTASRRLWKSIRGLLPVVKSLGPQVDAGVQANNSSIKEVGDPATSNNLPPSLQLDRTASEMPNMWSGGEINFDTDLGSMPDIFNIGDELIDLYDAFGTAAATQPLQPDLAVDNFGEQGLSVWEIGEISRHFQGLL